MLFIFFEWYIDKSDSNFPNQQIMAMNVHGYTPSSLRALRVMCRANWRHLCPHMTVGVLKIHPQCSLYLYIGMHKLSELTSWQIWGDGAEINTWARAIINFDAWQVLGFLHISLNWNKRFIINKHPIYLHRTRQQLTSSLSTVKKESLVQISRTKLYTFIL